MKKLKVVLVDDATEVRGRVKALLEDISGVEVVEETGDSLKAVEVVEVLRPHVVILDIHIPAGNGIGVLRHIKLFDPSIVVIMLTNFVASYYRAVCLKGGADFFFDKALELQDLKRTVNVLRHSDVIGAGTHDSDGGIRSAIG